MTTLYLSKVEAKLAEYRRSIDKTGREGLFVLRELAMLDVFTTELSNNITDTLKALQESATALSARISTLEKIAVQKGKLK